MIPDFALGPVGLDRAVLVAMDDQSEWVPRSLADIEAPVETVETS